MRESSCGRTSLSEIDAGGPTGSVLKKGEVLNYADLWGRNCVEKESVPRRGKSYLNGKSFPEKGESRLSTAARCLHKFERKHSLIMINDVLF